MAGLAEIFRRHGPDYRARFAQRMPQDQLRAMRDIEQCRTPRRGGHVWRCPKCGERFELFGKGNTEEIANAFDTRFLGKLGIDPEMARLGDAGQIEAYANGEFDPLVDVVGGVIAAAPDPHQH